MDDPSYNEMNIFVRELALKIAKATAENKKILIFWYYAGHAIQDNTVQMILNEAEGKYIYPIELQLRALSKCGNAYVVGLLDCCRQKVSMQPSLTRGGAGSVEPTEEGENIILAFGCPPSKFVPSASTLAMDFFAFLENSADAEGYIALPGNLNFFHTKDRKNETLVKVCQPALLRLT